MSKINDEVLKLARHNPLVRAAVDRFMNSSMGKTELYVLIIKSLASAYDHHEKKIAKLLHDQPSNITDTK